ncbi:MAG: VWA domain-containing protein [Rhodospirillaceae bacterium]
MDACGVRPARVAVRGLACAAAAAVVLAATPGLRGQQAQPPRFRTGVDVVSVSATVTDANGRFVRNLTRDDFVVYEDGVAQPVLYFSNERVPVSLGLALDTSGSMAGEKILAARGALSRFLVDLLGPDDEVFVYRFSDEAVLVQGWTTDRARLPRLLSGIHPSGETVLYDTVAESIPIARAGQHRKKALVVISDGNDTGSQTSIGEVQRQIRESEVLVYAVGIDANAQTGRVAPSPVRPRFPPIQIRPPWPGGGRIPGGRVPPRRPLPPAPPGPGLPPIGGGSGGGGSWNAEEPVNEAALRAMTDDSGGRTEIIRSARDLTPATTSIADELSRQYYLAYQSSAPRDGKWHDIRVEVRKGPYHVRARKGFVASAGQ